MGGRVIMTAGLVTDKKPNVIRITKEMYQDFFVLSEFYNVSVNQLIRNIVGEDIVLSIE
jgi:hypothetical protein